MLKLEELSRFGGSGYGLVHRPLNIMHVAQDLGRII